MCSPFAISRKRFPICFTHREGQEARLVEAPSLVLVSATSGRKRLASVTKGMRIGESRHVALFFEAAKFRVLRNRGPSR